MINNSRFTTDDIDNIDRSIHCLYKNPSLNKDKQIPYFRDENVKWRSSLHYQKLVALAECEANHILNNLILVCHKS